MAKIFKAHQIQIDSDKKVFVPHNQIMPKPEEKIDQEEAQFVDSVFRELSPEHLAGSGEKMVTEKKEANSEPENSEPEQTENAIKDTQPRPGSYASLSPAARKSRHMAALDTLKIKELELEALEEELRNWESELREKESAFNLKEQEFLQTMQAKRNEVDEESKRIIQMARSSSESLTSSAKAEAESIKKAAQIEVEDVRQKAYKEGFALGEEKGISAGEEQGLHEARIDWQNLMKESEMLINELQTSRMGVLKSSEEEMVRLIIAFARSVIKVEPQIQPDIVLKNIDAAINKVSDVDKIVMRINIKDKAMCQAHKDMFMQKLSTVTELQIIEDSSLSPGGIKIETGVGTIDATIESQAKELETALLEKFRRSQAQL